MEILMSLISIVLVFWFVSSIVGYLFWSKMAEMDKQYLASKKLKSAKK